MIVCGVDPGVSTGVVCMDVITGKVLASTTVRSFTAIQLLLEKHTPEQVIIENLPRNVDGDYSNFGRWIEELGYPVARISPSQWKPIATSNNWKFSPAQTSHEKDAYNLIRYWGWYLKSRDLGDR